MKTNVYYLDQKYNVNEKKRCVHCRLSFGIKMHNIPGIAMLENSDAFLDYMDFLTAHGSVGRYDKEKNMFVVTAEGIAWCHDDDKFDPDLGRKIALTRAQKSAFNIASIFYSDIKSFLDSVINDLDTMIWKCDVSKESCSNHIWELIEFNVKESE